MLSFSIDLFQVVGTLFSRRVSYFPVNCMIHSRRPASALGYIDYPSFGDVTVESASNSFSLGRFPALSQEGQVPGVDKFEEYFFCFHVSTCRRGTF